MVAFANKWKWCFVKLIEKHEDMASLKIETRQSFILPIVMLSFDSICNHIVESAISKVLSLRASSVNLCRWYLAFLSFRVLLAAQLNKDNNRNKQQDSSYCCERYCK